jgi:hypothetical protein
MTDLRGLYGYFRHIYVSAADYWHFLHVSFPATAKEDERTSEYGQQLG